METESQILAKAIMEIDNRLGITLPPETRKQLDTIIYKKYNEV